jgi:hypothetical protein
MFFATNAAVALPSISKTMRKVTRQKILTQLMADNNLLLATCAKGNPG